MLDAASNATAGSSDRTFTKDAPRSVPPRCGGTSRRTPIGSFTELWHEMLAPRAAASANSSVVLRIERIAQALPDQVEPEDSEKDHHTGENHQLRRQRVVALSLEEHATPG